MSGKLTNEEIARQFQLPERKSKLKSLLKQEREEYCLCRSSDTTRFMIGCDSCEDWFHGDCIGISERESKLIKLYFCQECRKEDSSLKILYRPGRKSQDQRSLIDDRMQSFKGRKLYEPYTSSHVVHKSSPVTPPYDESPSAKRGRPSKPTKLNNRQTLEKKTSKKIKPSLNKKGRSGLKGKRKANSDTESEDESDYEVETFDHMTVASIGSAYKDNMQCYGPHCVNVARKDSKYCSDECGKKLSANRILHILPHRVHDWTQTDSVSEMFAFNLVKEYKEKEKIAKNVLAELDIKNQELNRAIERAKEFEVDPENFKNLVEEVDITLYCITCGHEIHVRTALKHMEKCFNKYEGQSTFGSLYKTKIEGNNMFCDFYNPSNRTYCKRLRVLCPEHFKDPKVGKNEICGYPLVKDLFKETGDICMAPKKDCSRHFGWEKMRQAEIDMERVRQWLKIDDLAEKLRQTMSRVSGRVGTLPLLLHSTYDHELKEKMSPEEDQELLKTLEDSLMNRCGRDRFEKYRNTKPSNFLKSFINR